MFHVRDNVLSVWKFLKVQLIKLIKMNDKFKLVLKILSIYIVMVLSFGVEDYAYGLPLNWSGNMILSFFFIGVGCLFGGLLNLVHKR